MEALNRLLTVEELAEYLGVPVATIYAWRYRREGPLGFRVGKHLRFRWEGSRATMTGALPRSRWP